MPEYLSPGVYIQEVDSGPRPIEGVGTAMAAFVGFAPYSKYKDINRPVLITSWTQYVEAFGLPDENGRKNPHMKDAYLSYAVQGYFQNGGGRCYVTRVVPNGFTRKVESLRLAAAQSPTMPLLEITTNATDKDTFIAIEPAGDGKPEGTFTLKVRLDGDEDWDVYPDLSLAPEKGPTAAAPPKDKDKPDEPGAAPASPSGAAAAASSAPVAKRGVQIKNFKGSKVITITPNENADAGMTPRPGAYVIEVFQPMDKIERGSVVPKLLTGDAVERSGIEGMEIADDATMVCCPDLMSPLLLGADPKGATAFERIKSVQTAMVGHCATMADRVAILDAPPDMRAQEVKDWRNKQANFADPAAKFSALYYPWVMVDGPDSKPLKVPPCGHIAGVYARTDRTRGVHKAPANEGVLGIVDIAAAITKGEQDVLNPLGVNCIRSFPGRGTLIWGARTLSGDPAWRYISVRRLFNYVEKSLERGLQWVVFEPNDPDLWARVRRDISAFLTNCWRDGMLFGRSPDQAFYVKCDEELNPEEVRNVGQLIVEIGLAPVKPAEFVVFRFKQWSGGGS